MCGTFGKPLGTAIITLVLVWFTAAQGAAAEDRHEGYYYPTPNSEETYQARVNTQPEASRETRIAFVTAVTNRMAELPYPPQGAVFAKGTHGEKLIIVSLVDGRMDTIYRIRAVLANLTAATRGLVEFKEMDPAQRYWYTFLDLCKMLGFEKVTVTDGRELAHRILIK